MLDDIPKRWKYAIVIGVVVVLGVNIVFAFWMAPKIFFEQRNAAEDAAEDTYSWENAKTEYEWFKQQKHDIRAKEKQANNTQQQINRMHENYDGSPDEWPRDVRQNHERLHQQLLGQQNMHNEMVAEYNAKSEMEHKNLFKDELPYDMEEKFWTGDAR